MASVHVCLDMLDNPETVFVRDFVAHMRQIHAKVFALAMSCDTPYHLSIFDIIIRIFSSIESIMGYNLCGELSPYAEKFFAMSIIWLVVAINCASVKLTNQILKVQIYFCDN